MAQCVNLVFNSNYKTSGTNGNANYYIDWSAILQDNQKYSLSWTYWSQPNSFTGATKLASLYININTVNYSAGSMGAPTTNNMGNLLQSSSNSLYADTNFNTPITLLSRPTNNNVNVQVLTNDNPPIVWTDNAGTPIEPNNYILTLTFSPIN